MRTAFPRYKFIAAAILCLLALWLVPKLLTPAVQAAGLSINPGALRAGIAVVLFTVLGPVLVWSSLATRSFQLPLPFDRQTRAGLLVFAASFFAFLGYCFFTFSLNDPFLLWQMDGRRFEYLVRQQSVWFPFYTGYTNDFFHSLGNIWYPLNMKLDPGFLLATDPASGALDRRLSYLIFSAELYLATVLLGLAQIVIGLPGGFLWLTRRQKTGTAAPNSET